MELIGELVDLPSLQDVFDEKISGEAMLSSDEEWDSSGNESDPSEDYFPFLM